MTGSEMIPDNRQHIDVLLAVARVESKVDAYALTGTRHDDAINKVNNDVASLRDRVVAMESATTAARSATPTWWVALGAIIPTIGFVLLVAEKLYAK